MARFWLGGLVALAVGLPVSAAGQATGRAEDGSIDNLRHPPGTETVRAGTLGGVERRGSGPVHLLLLPGAPFGAEVWEAFMARNAERYTMWAITQPGYAGTAPPPMPSWENLSETPWLDGVQEALVRLIREEGIRRPFVVGHHLSGDRQALRLALEHPDLVSGVVVMAGVAGRNIATVDSTGTRRGARPEEVLPTIREQWLPTYRTTTPEQWRRGTYSASALSVDTDRGQDLFERQVSVPIPTQVRYFVELSTRDLRPEVPELEVPLLVIVPRPVGSLGEHFDLGAQRILALPEFQGMDEAEGRAAYVASRIERFGSEDAALRAVYGAEWLERTTTPADTRIEVVGPSGVFVFDDRPEDVDRILASWIEDRLRPEGESATLGPSPCPVEIRFDDAHTRMLTQWLRSDGDDVQAILEHAHTRTGIAKSRSMGLEVTSADLSRALREARAGRRLDPDPFRMNDLAADLERTERFLERLRDDRAAVQERICDVMRRHVPEGYRAEQTVVLMSAVNTTGFSWNDGRFYLITERFGEDFPGMLDVALHESFHAVQEDLAHASVRQAHLATLGPTTANVLRLLRDVYREGSASWVGDPIAAGEEGQMRAFQYGRFARGLAGIERHANLFDFVLYRTAHDPDMAYQDAYEIGLLGSEYFYYLGYVMAKAIEETDGSSALASYLSRPPTEFFGRYLEISACRDDPVRFAPTTVSIIESMAERGVPNAGSGGGRAHTCPAS